VSGMDGLDPPHSMWNGIQPAAKLRPAVSCCLVWNSGGQVSPGGSTARRPDGRSAVFRVPDPVTIQFWSLKHRICRYKCQGRSNGRLTRPGMQTDIPISDPGMHVARELGSSMHIYRDAKYIDETDSLDRFGAWSSTLHSTLFRADPTAWPAV